MLTLINEQTRECLAIDVARSLKSEEVLERLSNLFVRRGVPTYIRFGVYRDEGPRVDGQSREKTLFIKRRRHFNASRAHNSLGYRVPNPQAIQPASLASATTQRAKQASGETGPTPT